MHDTSRRRFIGATGAGAAAVALAPATAYAKEQATRSKTSATESVVAVVPDADSDELTLLVGEREVVVRDRDLVTRILNAAGRK